MSDFRSDLRDRLPLPLARLYRRAFNAKARTDRHHNAYYLLEATVKTLASAQIAVYLAGGRRDAELDRRLRNLALPSIGHWVEFLRSLAERNAALDPHPFPEIAGSQRLLGERRDDLPAISACLAAMGRELKGKIRPLDFVNEIPSYRNMVLGHAGQRDESYYGTMGELLFEAALEFLDRVPLLGVSVLNYVAETRTLPSGIQTVDLWDLTGTDALRVGAAQGSEDTQDICLQPGHLYLKRGAAYLDLHPLLVCAAGGPEDGVLFLNRSKLEKRVEYLDYVSGETSPAPELLEDHRRILGAILGAEVSTEKVLELQAASYSDQPDPEESRDATATQRRFGDFDLLAKLGEGGMGTVYLARQRSLGRLVALKLMPPALSNDDIAAARFSREVRALARSDHPHVVRILASGRTEGLYWYTMEYVEGSDLREVAAAMNASQSRDLDRAVSTVSERKRQEMKDLFPELPEAPKPPAMNESGEPFRKLASCFRDAATGLQHLHERGVIHRDVAPGNLMVTVDGRAVVMDLGLAKVIGETTFTRPDSVLGTLKYTAPEQLNQALLEIDQRVDVYGLGATLYDLVTGRPPHEGETTEILIKKVLQETPIGPRRLAREIPIDLDAVIQKAMDKVPERRYSSAIALAEDLDRFIRSEPTEARPIGPISRTVRWLQRNRGLASASAVVFLALLTAAIVFHMKGDEARLAKLRAEQETKAKEAALDDYDRLADSKLLESLITDSDPAHPWSPASIQQLEVWQKEYERLADRLEGHRTSLAGLRLKALPYSQEDKNRDFASEISEISSAEVALAKIAKASREAGADERSLGSAEQERMAVATRIAELETLLRDGRRSWRFEDPTQGFQHDLLAKLVSDLESLAHDETGLVASVAMQMKTLRELATATLEGEVALRWSACRERITTNPQYAGLDIAAQLGLIPLGPDPHSGLEEFLHWLTHKGSIPPRDDKTGKIAITEELGVVLVLIPGGTFLMGSQEDDPSQPNFDPDSRDDEHPVNEISLQPYLLSKYEMTQAQWHRAFVLERNPSRYARESQTEWRAQPTSPVDPVLGISYFDVQRLLLVVDLELPTEAEWERAARAGRSDRIWAGTSDQSELGDFAQLHGGDPMTIGSKKPNEFGFHDMSGSAWEWCQDWYDMEAYQKPAGPRGLRGETVSSSFRVYRGGSFLHDAANARVAYRNNDPPEYRNFYLGLRPSRIIP